MDTLLKRTEGVWMRRLSAEISGLDFRRKFDFFPWVSLLYLTKGIEPPNPRFSSNFDDFWTKMILKNVFEHLYNFSRPNFSFWTVSAHLEGDWSTLERVTEWFWSKITKRSNFSQRLGYNYRGIVNNGPRLKLGPHSISADFLSENWGHIGISDFQFRKKIRVTLTGRFLPPKAARKFWQIAFFKGKMLYI